MTEFFDEYKKGDPYAVNNTINSEFHRRRFFITAEYVQKALASLKISSPKVMDVGCGEGYITQKIKELIPKAHIFGIDNSDIAIKTANKKFAGINFAVGDVMNLPHAHGWFDIVVCNNLIEHVNDPVKMLLEINKKLKKGGFLIISTPSPYRIENLFSWLIRGKICLMSDNHFKEYSIREMINILKKTGYIIEDFKSKPLKYAIKNPKKYLIHKIIKPILIVMFFPFPQIKIGLESTIFYLVKK